ncbi:NUDIX domain-containing protein [Flavobacterium sp. Sd200]|uniref:NUDIX hydrolase n=1 Tax=Flavobacterium sp. Sd200 TaxID=2692211 RepID=UPI001370E1AA|nr:CoA pyrophosphatase [Flavobacterium sp. Sd200]MXN89982.1 NUDIX domain-containing protein [Flavobacterium sp. Sd200]
MLFDTFTKYLPKITTQPLPALDAHIKMAPQERIPSLDPHFREGANPRCSAVMMLCYPKNGEATLVLIKRNTYPGIHSAQISFPGGKAEPEDIDLSHTALRETWEEVGIAQTEIDIVKQFTEIYIPPSNFLVTPFLGITTEEPVFTINPMEVDGLIELPLKDLLDDSIIVNVDMKTSYLPNVVVPAFNVGGHIVWGATAMILSELKETIKIALK